MGMSFAQRQKFAKTDYILTGERIGRQELVDYMQIVLHQHGWGVGRIIPFTKEVMEMAEYFAPAFCKGPEQDVWQERLDRELRAIAKDKVSTLSFNERYPEIRSMGFKRLHDVTPIEYKGAEHE